ncbi:hypothetical protein GBBBJNDB_00225 [Pseudomonas phage Callisto]|nr:hypothetical protein GBBBJNDB_00225 [Pseudomonas phage Callisto]
MVSVNIPLIVSNKIYKMEFEYGKDDVLYLCMYSDKNTYLHNIIVNTEFSMLFVQCMGKTIPLESILYIQSNIKTISVTDDYGCITLHNDTFCLCTGYFQEKVKFFAD